MITKITQDYSNLYSALFAKAETITINADNLLSTPAWITCEVRNKLNNLISKPTKGKSYILIK